MPAFVRRLNDAAKRKVLALQEYFSLAWKALRFIFARPFYGGDVIQQMDAIGVQSLPIVLLTGLFTGMVLALQSAVQLEQFGATMYIGRLVAASMIRELGPVLAGLMVAGRVGSGIAAQLGSMKVTEQIDALNTLGTDPIKKLVTPRVLAALIMMPVLTVLTDLVGIFGGNIIASAYIGLPTSLYWRTVWEQIAAGGFTLRYIPNDFVQGLAKPFVFGGIIAITGCHYGLQTTGGTEGVGLATTRTVVTASILILVVDYFMTQIILALFTPAGATRRFLPRGRGAFPARNGAPTRAASPRAPMRSGAIRNAWGRSARRSATSSPSTRPTISPTSPRAPSTVSCAR